MAIPTTDYATVDLNFDRGTLWAAPEAGHLRAEHNTVLIWSADFPFRIEFAQLTGPASPLPNQEADKNSSGKYAVTVTLLIVPDDTDAPSYKYTIKGDGKAAGKVLDPIIIVNKK